MKDIRYVPLHKPWFDEKEEKEVIDTLRSGWITTAKKTALFEKRFAEFTGAKYAVALSSCTAALYLSLICSGISEGDEVISTPFTFAATTNTILHSGAVPVFADIKKDDLNIDPEKIEDKITNRTKIILPVHYAGIPCDMDKILSIADRHNLKVIEDAAHAAGSEYKGVKIGSGNNPTCFSFYANKNITTGEGGIITTNDQEIAKRVKLLSLHGLSAGAWNRYEKKGTPHYEIVEAGYKFNMSDIMASLGLHQLDKIGMFRKKRERIVNIYNQNLNDLDELNILKPPDNVKSSYYIYVIILNKERLTKSRNEIAQMLKEEGYIFINISGKDTDLAQMISQWQKRHQKVYCLCPFFLRW